jgi:hypothetical protein
METTMTQTQIKQLAAITNEDGIIDVSETEFDVCIEFTPDSNPDEPVHVFIPKYKFEWIIENYLGANKTTAFIQ